MQFNHTYRYRLVDIGRSLTQEEKIKKRRGTGIAEGYRREVVEIIGDTSYGYTK